jgi:hypothetical protein
LTEKSDYLAWPEALTQNQNSIHKMNLDFIRSINVDNESMVRLYDFNRAEATQFRDLIQQTILLKKKPLDLSNVGFIESRNCLLTLRISDENTGIITSDRKKFFCDLTLKGYEEMIAILEPFCKKETKGYQWLYEIDNPIDFLFSPGGTW